MAQAEGDIDSKVAQLAAAVVALAPVAIASTPTYRNRSLSPTGRVSLGAALVAGMKRATRPETENTALAMRTPATTFGIVAPPIVAALGSRRPALSEKRKRTAGNEHPDQRASEYIARVMQAKYHA